MSTGGSAEQPDIKDLLAIGAGDIVIPGQEEYFKGLIGSDESPFLVEPTAEEVRQREEDFARKVVFAGISMASRNPGIVTVLSDVDQTFTENEGRTIRPAFPFALNVLHGVLGDRLEVGLLTTIPQATINERLPIYFKGVSAKVNPDFAISSRGRERADPGLCEAVDKLDFSTVEDIVDPEIIKGTKDGNLRDIWLGSKLIILQQLVRHHPARSFVFVDDLVWANVIRDDHPQITGVWVGEEMQNSRGRLGRDRLSEQQ